MGSSKLALASRVTLEVRSLCLRIKEGNPSGRDKFFSYRHIISAKYFGHQGKHLRPALA